MSNDNNRNLGPKKTDSVRPAFTAELNMPFVLAGTLSVSTSPRFYVSNSGSRLIAYVASLHTAGSSDTILKIIRGTANGTDIVKVITIPGGEHVAEGTLLPAPTLTGPTWLQVEVNTAGAGAADLCCQLLIQ